MTKCDVLELFGDAGDGPKIRKYVMHMWASILYFNSHPPRRPKLPQNWCLGMRNARREGTEKRGAYK